PWAISPVTSKSRRSRVPADRYGTASSGITYRSPLMVLVCTPPVAPAARRTSTADLPPASERTRTTSPVISVTVLVDAAGRFAAGTSGAATAAVGVTETVARTAALA